MIPQTRYQYAHWTYVSGPTHQLHTWGPYMERVAASNLHVNRHFFIHCINQHPINHIYDGFPWDTFAEACAAKHSKQMIVVLDAHTEGPSWRHIRSTVERMIAEFNVDPQCIIQWTGSSGENCEPIQVVPVMDAFSIITDAEQCDVQTVPKHHFVMLARIPKPHRVLMAIDILERELDSYGYISCGSHGPPDNAMFDELVSANMRTRFPLLLPGGYWSDIYAHQEHLDSVRLPQVTEAFCSVIPETSHDLCSPNVCTAFMTEKSEKCFLLEQVPLWVAAPGQAALARSWGFDLFEDLVDHSYDLVVDPYLRIRMVGDQLEKLCREDIGRLQKYKQDHADRFAANRELCFYLRRNHTEIQYHKLVDCINRMHVPAVP